MVHTKELYVMVSRTETGIARIIRAVSGYPYNHVSVTPDPTLRSWYSFARYVRSAPFYSGFICESPERLSAETGEAQVRIYRVEVPAVNVQGLEELIPLAGAPDSGLIYNHFDALANSLGCHVPVPRCHTCLSFACELLDQRHTSIASLCDALAPCLIYEGALSRRIPLEEAEMDAYFSHMGWVRGSVHSVMQLGVLTLRTLSHGCQCYCKHICRRTVR